MKLQDVLELDIDILLPLLRQNGIEALSIGDVSITLSSRQEENVTEVESTFKDEIDKLSCGHYTYEANELGECLHGCLPTEERE